MKYLQRYPWIFSLLLILALALWLGSGRIQAGVESAPTEDKQAETPLPRVRVEPVVLQKISRRIRLYGRSEADRHSEIRSRISGRIQSISVERGDRVRKGQELMRIDLENREQQLVAAQALQAQRELEYRSSKKLNTQGYQGKAKLAQSLAALKQAQAEVSRLQQEIRDARILAPFDGIIGDRPVETGDWVSRGQTLAQLYDLQPLIARGDASPDDMRKLRTGMAAKVRVHGEEQDVPARIRYIAPAADSGTGTFRIEAAFDNPQQRLQAGLATRIDIELDAVEAMHITPALFALSDSGELGVKWVNNGIVEFTPIDIVRSDDEGVWITGLQPGSRLIVVGQGFVRPGDRVEAVETTADPAGDPALKG